MLFRYAKCGKYILKATTNNLNTSSAEWRRFLKRDENKVDIITVHCDKSLSNTTQATFPALHNGVVNISLARPLIMEIQAPNSKNPTYTINWGDGKIEKIIGRTKFDHKYNATGTYSVTGTIQSGNTTAEIKSLTVIVERCGSPLLAFSYGTKKYPEVYTKSMTRDIIGAWFYNTPECEQQVSPLFNFSYWRLSNETWEIIVKDVNNTKAKIEKLVDYRISPGDLEKGFYNIELAMMYKGRKEIYKGFIQMDQSRLVPELSNGIRATVPYEILQNEEERVTHDFIIDARKSYDPDNPKAKNDKMTFEWWCMIIGNNSEIEKKQKVVLNITNRNKELDFNTCNHKSFEQLTGETAATVRFNTGMFLPGMKYKFKMVVKKDQRNESTFQTLELSEDITPPITIE